MAALRRRRRGEKFYWYLAQSYRLKGIVRTKELYLGTKKPSDLKPFKVRLAREVRTTLWGAQLKAIRRGFLREQQRTPESAKKKERQTFAVRFTYDTNRIEGSTLTLRETSNLLERGFTPGGKPLADAQEALAHEATFKTVLAMKSDLSLANVMAWHQALFATTKPDIAGRVRHHQVLISGSQFIPPSPAVVSLLLDEFFAWYRKKKMEIQAVELAALVHLKFVTIHPFADGNGRISRLLMNFVLARRGWPLLNIHYENRAGYYNALERAQTRGDDEVFVQWFVRRYAKENARYAGKY